MYPISAKGVGAMLSVPERNLHADVDAHWNGQEKKQKFFPSQSKQSTGTYLPDSENSCEACQSMCWLLTRPTLNMFPLRIIVQGQN